MQKVYNIRCVSLETTTVYGLVVSEGNNRGDVSNRRQVISPSGKISSTQGAVLAELFNAFVTFNSMAQINFCGNESFNSTMF